MTSFMHSIAIKGEAIVDALKNDEPEDELHLQPYLGYSTPETIIVRGRALYADISLASNDTPSMIDKIAAMAALFMTKEARDETISFGDISVVTDEEGYYTIEFPRPKGVRPGWSDVKVVADRTDTQELHPVLVTSDRAEYGIISDIDDTVMNTKAWSTRKNIWTSVTGSVGSRYVFPDTSTLLKRMSGSMSGRKNPVYYVSSSPWNLHGFLEAVFTANGVVRGPKFLRDFGIDSTKMIVGKHDDHKGKSIDKILAANPELPFYLLGDSGQHDPVIYRDAVRRHPGRIKGVFIRTPEDTLDDHETDILREIRAAGVQIFAGETFEPLLDNDF